MKTRLIVFVLSAAILGGSNTALARGDKGQRYEEPRAQHTQRRDWDNNKQHARGHRDVNGTRHADRRLDHRSGRGMNRRHHHSRGWSGHQPRYHHGRSNRGQRGRYAHRGRHYYQNPHGHGPARPFRHLSNGLSITLHGHF